MSGSADKQLCVVEEDSGERRCLPKTDGSRRRLAGLALLRRLIIPLFSVLNPGDINIRHHFTGTPFRLHSFRHKGYWFYGRRRESETMKYFAEFIDAGDSVIEVGGHIGYISVYLAKLAGTSGKIYVLEPGENNLPYLKRNTRVFPNVTIIEMGAADIDGELMFYVEELTGQNNSFVKNYDVLQSNVRNANVKPKIIETRVPVIRVDTVVESYSLKPTFIKIDVEGFELQVLKGTKVTLSASKPGLMVEVTQHAQEVFALLKDYGYLCYDQLRKMITDPVGMRGNVFCLHPEVHQGRMERLRLEY